MLRSSYLFQNRLNRNLSVDVRHLEGDQIWFLCSRRIAGKSYPVVPCGLFSFVVVARTWTTQTILLSHCFYISDHFRENKVINAVTTNVYLCCAGNFLYGIKLENIPDIGKVDD